MSGESWKKMGVDYKDSKQPNIEDEEWTSWVKKKPKTRPKKSDHKHEYVPGLFTFNKNDRQNLMTGFYCKICGRVQDMHIMWGAQDIMVYDFIAEHPDAEKITLSDEWDFFKDKNIPV